MSQHRRTLRHPCRLAVRIMDVGRTQPALTGDISDHGLFVRVDESWVPNALVRLHLLDPEDPRPLMLLGIVARCIPAADIENPEGPGIGISLFGNSRPTEARWKALVRRAQGAASGWRDPLDAGAVVVDAVRRKHTRRTALLELELEVGGRRQHADLVDLCEGGAFLQLENALESETSARLHLSPRKGDPVDVHVVVDRVQRDGPHRGVAVRVTPLSVAERTAWTEFLALHAPIRRTLPAFLPSFDVGPKDDPPA